MVNRTKNHSNDQSNYKIFLYAVIFCDFWCDFLGGSRYEFSATACNLKWVILLVDDTLSPYRSNTTKHQTNLKSNFNKTSSPHKCFDDGNQKSWWWQILEALIIFWVCNFGHLLWFFSSSAPFLSKDFWGWPLLWCSRFSTFLRTAVAAAQFLVDCNVKLCEANQFYYVSAAAATTPLHWGERKNLFIRDFGLWKSKYFLPNSLIHLSWKERFLGKEKKKQNFQIMWPLFQAIHVPSSILGSLFSTQELQLGLVWRRGALALHLLKPLARENAQPSEDYVCTISKPGTTSKTNGFSTH